MQYNIKNQEIAKFNNKKWNNYNFKIDRSYGSFPKPVVVSIFGQYNYISNNRYYHNFKNNSSSIKAYKFASLRRLSKNINLAILGKTINN
jgi:hypothetical protein